jgi:hypothetical protein
MPSEPECHSESQEGAVDDFSAAKCHERVERRALRRQPNDHHFGLLLMPPVTAGAFLLVTWIATEGAFLLPPGGATPLKTLLGPWGCK